MSLTAKLTGRYTVIPPSSRSRASTQSEVSYAASRSQRVCLSVVVFADPVSSAAQTPSSPSTAVVEPSTPAVGAGKRITIEGIAELRRAETLYIDGYRVKASGSTRFTGKHVGAWVAIPLGYIVTATAIVQPDGTLVAEEVEARPRKRTTAGHGVVVGALSRRGSGSRAGVEFGTLLPAMRPKRVCRRLTRNTTG